MQHATVDISATFEDALVSSEQVIFENVDVSRVPKPITQNSEKAQLLRKNGTL